MAYSVSLAQLQTRALQRVNLEGAVGPNGAITPQELTDLANVGIAKWYDLIVNSTWNGNYYRAPYYFNVTPGQGTPNPPQQNPPPGSIYNLPNDFYRVISLDAFVSPTLIITCTPFQEEERNFYRFWLGAVGWFIGTTVYYQCQGVGSGGTPTIVLMPPPQSVFQMKLNYIPIAPKLSSPGATIDSINGWDEYIVLDMAINLLLKFGRMDQIAIYSAKQEQEKQRILSSAPRRDNNSAERVHEINDDGNDGWFY
jgi:hypothetical protein